MSLNPGGATNYNWNYSKMDKEGFSLEMTGTVVAMQEVQAREFNPASKQPGRPRFWPDGNPVMNIRIGFATPDGSLKSITFTKAGKAQIRGEKPSLHMQLYRLTSGNMLDLMGKTIHLWTWPTNPETDQPWGLNNPRLFGVEEVEGKYELSGSLPDEFKVPELLCNDGASGGQPAPMPPQQIQQPNVMPMAGGFYAAPPAQQYPQYPQYQQPQVQQTQMTMQQQMPAIQAMPPQSAPMPQGIDPAVAAAMQAAGAVNVQPVGGLYDDVPF